MRRNAAPYSHASTFPRPEAAHGDRLRIEVDDRCDWALELEHGPGRGDRVQCLRGIAAIDRPPTCEQQVVELLSQGASPVDTLPAVQCLDGIFRPEAREVGTVTFLGRASSVRPVRRELPGRVFPNAEVHREQRHVAGVGLHGCAQQALVAQRLHYVGDRRRLWPGCDVDDRFSGLEREGPVERRALRQGGLFPCGEKRPRPVDGREQRRLPLRCAAHPAEPFEAIAHSQRKLPGGEHADARRGQFDRKGKAVEQADDFGNGRAIGFVEHERRSLRARSLDE